MSKLITLPGLIDIHVHLRDPGQTDKEDFFTGTAAALAGGFTTVIDMPNNIVSITTAERLDEKISIAQQKTICDIGFYFGSLGDNLEEFKEIQSKVFGIKLYLNHTTGNYLINSDILEKVYSAWAGEGPILTHAEGETVKKVMDVVSKYRKRTHICHVSSKEELSYIIEAKKNNLPITCGVCAHHLFLTQNDVEKLGPYGLMKPSLKTQLDQDFLWENLKYVDVIESDHAPHTKEEKMSDKTPFGVPGLETTLPLLLTTVSKGKLSIERVIELCHTNPARIFHIPLDQDTKVEVDLEEEWIIENKNLKTKCGWSPFDGMKVKGKVKRVFLHGKKVFEDDKILVEQGSGRVIFPKT